MGSCSCPVSRPVSSDHAAVKKQVRNTSPGAFDLSPGSAWSQPGGSLRVVLCSRLTNMTCRWSDDDEQFLHDVVRTLQAYVERGLID